MDLTRDTDERNAPITGAISLVSFHVDRYYYTGNRAELSNGQTKQLPLDPRFGGARALTNH